MSKLISNTSPIIALSMIDKLNLLWDLFDKVYISIAVYNEIISNELENAYGKKEILNAIQSEKIIPYNIKDELLVNKMHGKLHKGELETIVGGIELNVDFVLIDEKPARNIAKTFFLTPIGTIGILRIAKRKGKITQIKPLIDLLMSKGFRISKNIYNQVLKLEKEN